MPRCTVDADFLKSVLEEAKAAERWAEATYQLFMKKGEISLSTERPLPNLSPANG